MYISNIISPNSKFFKIVSSKDAGFSFKKKQKVQLKKKNLKFIYADDPLFESEAFQAIVKFKWKTYARR